MAKARKSQKTITVTKATTDIERKIQKMRGELDAIDLGDPEATARFRRHSGKVLDKAFGEYCTMLEDLRRELILNMWRSEIESMPVPPPDDREASDRYHRLMCKYSRDLDRGLFSDGI